VPDVQRRLLFGRRSIFFWHLAGLNVLAHRVRHTVHLALSSRLLALLQIVTLIQHAILVLGVRTIVSSAHHDRRTLERRGRRKGRQPELPAEERVLCAEGADAQYAGRGSH
jgi:hypothetical protein